MGIGHSPCNFWIVFYWWVIDKIVGQLNQVIRLLEIEAEAKTNR